MKAVLSSQQMFSWSNLKVADVLLSAPYALGLLIFFEIKKGGQILLCVSWLFLISLEELNVNQICFIYVGRV